MKLKKYRLIKRTVLLAVLSLFFVGVISTHINTAAAAAIDCENVGEVLLKAEVDADSRLFEEAIEVRDLCGLSGVASGVHTITVNATATDLSTSAVVGKAAGTHVLVIP